MYQNKFKSLDFSDLVDKLPNYIEKNKFFTSTEQVLPLIINKNFYNR